MHVVTRKPYLGHTSVGHTHTVRHTDDKTNLLLQTMSLFACYECLDDSDDIFDPKWRLKCPRNFRPPPRILPTLVSLDLLPCTPHASLSGTLPAPKSAVLGYASRGTPYDRLSPRICIPKSSQQVVTRCPRPA